MTRASAGGPRRPPLVDAGVGVGLSLLPLLLALARPETTGLPLSLAPYLTAAAALVAVLAFWIVWHVDGARRPASVVWLAAGLLGSALLRFLEAPGPAASLLVASGLIGAAAIGPGRLISRWQRLALLAGVLACSGLLAALDARPTAPLLLGLLAAATVLAWRRARQQPTQGPANLFAAGALALLGQIALARQAAPGDVLELVGALYEIGALVLLYRAVLHQSLRQSLQRLGELANTLQAVASPLLVADVDGRIRWVNAAFCQATGYRADELMGQPTRLLEADDASAPYPALHAAIRAGKPWQGQLPVRRQDGSCYMDDRRSTPVHDDLGALTGHVWVGDDITERNRSVEQLRQSEDALRRLVDSAPDTILVTDGAGRIQHANPRVHGLLGYTAAEVQGMDLKQLMPPDAASQHDHYMRGHGQGRRGMTAAGREVQALRKDGSRVYVHVRVGEMPAQGGRRFVGFLRDMTEHKRAEAALRLSEEKLRKLYDLSPLGIALTDMDGRFLDFNAAFATLCGHDPQTLRGLSYWDLTPPEFVAQEQDNLAQLRSTGRYGPYEKAYRRGDGSLRPVCLNGVRIELDGQPCIWSIVEDLTERCQAERERERLQRQLMQAQKMEALGQLTGGVAHDFNNMLTGILGLSSLALDRHVEDPNSKIANYLREIVKVSERGRDLVERLMRFARPASVEPLRPRPLRPVVEEVLRMLESTWPAQLTVTLRAEPDLPDACFAEVDLHQALTNLVINARDATGGCGKVALELLHIQPDGRECTSCGERVRGAQVALRVSDNGGGIAPALLSRIFDPFFTTKEVGKGTGLGLAMVHSVVHQAGGHVVVTSAAGQGTTFELLLPVAPQAGDDPARAGPAPAREPTTAGP